MFNTQRPTRRAAATMLVAMLAVAACGSDDDAAVEVDATDVGGAVETVIDEAEETTADLAQTLRDNGLDSIASVVDQIDVSEVVGDGEFTFFAPDDEAFTSLSADETADLLTDPARILDVLRNHAVAGTITADELASVDSVTSEAGERLDVSVDGDTVTVGGVTVVSTDIEVGGGVIHVVDGFLLVS